LGSQNIISIRPNKVGNTEGLFEKQRDQPNGQSLPTLDPIESLPVIEGQGVKKWQSKLQEPFNNRSLPQEAAPAIDREELLGIEFSPPNSLWGQNNNLAPSNGLKPLV